MSWCLSSNVLTSLSEADQFYGGKTYGFIDGTQIFSTAQISTLKQLRIASYWVSRPGFYNDQVIVRKYVNPEPEITRTIPPGNITRGEFTSVPITPPSITGWDKFYTSNTTIPGTTITYENYGCLYPPITLNNVTMFWSRFGHSDLPLIPVNTCLSHTTRRVV